jgi:N-acetyl-gamma-glutamyl-phosphate reductase
MKNPKNIAVVGVSGYTGFELAKILLRHPQAQKLTFYVREAHGAHCLTEMFPQLRGWGQAPVKALSVEAIVDSGAGTAFLATPHEASAELAPGLLEAGMRMVDLSGAFRFREAETFARWYKLPTPHAAWLGDAVYGLPEFYAKEIAQAKLVANPGCYASSVILAVRQLAES